MMKAEIIFSFPYFLISSFLNRYFYSLTAEFLDGYLYGFVVLGEDSEARKVERWEVVGR